MTDDIQARLARLSPADRERVAGMLEARSRTVGHPEDAGPRSRASHDAPLSWQQERIWYLEQLGLGETFPLVHVIRMMGVLDVAAMTQAINALVGRHEPLRSVVRVVDGVPRQVVLAVPEDAVRVLAAQDSEDGERLVRDTVEAMTRGGLTASSSTFRAVLISMGPRQHALILGVHHIAFDGWSAGILFDELGSSYAALATDAEVRLPPLPYSYSDYASWQRARPLDVGAVDSWRRALADLDEPADLVAIGSADFEPHAFGTVRTTIGDPLLVRLRALSRDHGATLFMLLDAAVSILVSRWSGAPDVVAGTPVAGRDLTGLADMVGCFSTVVPLRVRVDPWATSLEILSRARDACLTAFDHADVPVEQVVPTAGGRRASGRHPLYAIMLVASGTSAPLSLPGLEVNLKVADRVAADTALTIGIDDRGNRLDLSFEYNTELIAEPDVQRFARHLVTLLGSVADDPSQRVADLTLVGADELREILASGDRSFETVNDPHLTLDGLFVSHALGHPDDIALVDDDGPVTYATVAGRVSRLVELLEAEGSVAPVVALGLSHSVDYVVAVLAVLQTGAAYLALDPALPDDRIRLMLEDSGAELAVVDGPTYHRLPAVRGHLRLVRWPDTDTDTDRAPVALSVRRAVDAPAYLIYTSGSTGRPKAVVGTHRAMVNRLSWHWTAFPPTPEDVCCLKTSPAFVDAVAELFTGLLRGTPSAVLSRDDTVDVDRLASALERFGVTRIVVVPDLLAALLDLPDVASRLRRITQITVSGSRLLPHLIEAVSETLGDCTLVNLYGSSEVAADVTWWVCRGDEQRVPIGSVISGVRCRVVDQTGALVPVGVPGELLIGGVALAQGYAHRPGLTARAFVPDPWSEGERLYRTGDRVRWREPGVLEFLGRLDAQVKIRGVRVEPGEIEAALQACPGVAGAAVVAHNGPTGDPTLSGFVTGSADLDTVRRLLKKRLPAGMVPSTIERIEQLPRTPSGKVDRLALASWAATRGRHSTRDTARRPKGSDERLIASVWGEAVGLQDPSLDDDFFSVGGHSLAITKLSARLSSALGRDVPIRLIHENPVLGDLCDALVRPETSSAREPRSRLPVVPACAVTTTSDVRLDVQIIEGALLPLDAAAITYVPGDWRRDGLLPADRWQREFVDPDGLLASVLDTPFGRIGVMVAPISSDDLYADPARTAAVTARLVDRAGWLGARAVSLTGLLPSATGYGATVAPRSGVPVTTGHEVTAAAVVLTVTSILDRLSRPIDAETVCILGAGSIGRASARLLLDAGHTVGRLVLCDLYARRDVLEAQAEELASLAGGEISIVATAGPPPAEIYSAGVIVGAVNVGGILDADRVRSGAVVVDDSYPRCFDVPAALQRMSDRGDAIFLEAGLVSAPTAVPELRYLPQWLVPAVGDVTTRRYEPEIMGCILSSALLANTPGRAPTIGAVRPADATETLRLLRDSGFTAARPQVDGHVVPPDVLDRTARPQLN